MNTTTDKKNDFTLNFNNILIDDINWFLYSMSEKRVWNLYGI